MSMKFEHPLLQDPAFSAAEFLERLRLSSPEQLEQCIRLLGMYLALYKRQFGELEESAYAGLLGFDPAEEIGAYGARIDNVHVKDRVLGGTTVPLGTGNANFPVVFQALKRSGYAGNFILQTARATDGDHPRALRRYRGLVTDWLKAA